MNTEPVSGEQAPAHQKTIIVPPDGGTTLHAFGDAVQIKLGGAQTNGSLVVALGTIPPGAGPPPHVHHNEDELFLILEGSYRFLVDGQWSETVGAGTLVYTPRGVIHTFQSVGDTPCKHWVIATPSGFEHFFASCADVFAQPGPPNRGQILTIAGKHALEFVPPLTGPPPAGREAR